ncbi:MAG TPA: sec-independent translocase [Actinomycetes bacterium]|nr:sec-independent translocase [Actinomycetes bacterium]
MFDVGPGEVIGLAVVALVVVGPDKLPRYAADAARMLRQVRRMASEARDEVTRELGPELKDLDLADLDPRQLVRKHLLEPINLDDLDDDDRDHDDHDGAAGDRSASNGDAPRRRSAPENPPGYDEDVT